MNTPHEQVSSSSPEFDESERKRLVGLLLATQQELIDLRYRRDREHRVLEGIVAFTEDVQSHADARGFWATVVDASVKTFDCESALVVAWDGTQLRILASCGPAPADEVESEALTRRLRTAADRPAVLLTVHELHDLRFGGRALALLMVATLEHPTAAHAMWLVLAVSTVKQPFFPQFDVRSVPGLRMFASTAAVLHEMHQSRQRIQGQVHALDAANAELERRITEQVQTAADREQLRSQLAQSRRIESIGRLAGGVAHDFNNLLTVIIGHAELIRTDDLLVTPHLESITEVLTAASRAQSLTQQLLMFSRKQVIRPTTVELNQLITESLRLYRRLIGEDIALTFTPSLDELPVLADRQQFDQLLSNLVLNARDAIYAQPLERRRCEIAVTSAIVEHDSPLHGGIPAARIVVRDSGIGMTDEVRQNIFEPFYSTKDVGKGTGLGLSTVLGIIQQNGGTIDVKSRPDEGSAFIVYWPLEHVQTPVAADAVPESNPAAGDERVVLVEDEEQVRTFMLRGLVRLGFSVSAFPDGEAALTHMLAHGPPDVLVTDVVMPRLNGRQLAEALHAHHPDVPVVFMSGYTDDIVAQQGIIRDDMELLQKPFSPLELARRIRRVLAARQTGHRPSQ